MLLASRIRSLVHRCKSATDLRISEAEGLLPSIILRKTSCPSDGQPSVVVHTLRQHRLPIHCPRSILRIPNCSVENLYKSGWAPDAGIIAKAALDMPAICIAPDDPHPTPLIPPC